MTVRTANCRSCDAAIVWLKTQSGANMPVDADSVDEIDFEGLDRPIFDFKEHVSHFDTCPNADDHRRRS